MLKCPYKRINRFITCLYLNPFTDTKFTFFLSEIILKEALSSVYHLLSFYLHSCQSVLWSEPRLIQYI